MLDLKFNHVNTLRPRQNGRHFPDDIFKWIFLNENIWISINISLKFVPRGRIHNNPTLVQIMAWRRPGDKPLSEPMVISLLTQWVNTRGPWWWICVSGIMVTIGPGNGGLWPIKLNQCWLIVHWTLWIKPHWNLNQTRIFFFNENSFAIPLAFC